MLFLHNARISAKPHSWHAVHVIIIRKGSENEMLYPRIRELRQERHLTQRQVTELLQISLSSYSRYENETADIPLAVLCNLAVLHHTSLDYIVERTDQRIPHKRLK